MKLTRLKLIGFKSFVEPTEFLIEPGLTGVVGPNGCGKSNLVEALRWVMGESSYKSLRASGMDDVIFSGSGHRPSRNMAEVSLHLDNRARTAPAAFNDLDQIEVSRRIEREAGSHYRVNSREVRARDVQLLFADAATGARSHAMVRQGQIGEIIAAKPQARRRILEDAAGIAGLHSRRHEAELRLKAAEENIRRVDDVLNQINEQIDGLKRQSRQAARYRNVASDIRKIESLLLFRAWQAAAEALNEAERTHAGALSTVQTHALVQAATAKDQAVLAAGMAPLRDAEVAAAAGLQRLTLAREALDGEERRAKQRAIELERRETELRRDLEREDSVRTDADTALGLLDTEDAALLSEAAAAESLARDSTDVLREREAAKVKSEAALQDLRAKVADLSARYAAAQRALADEQAREQRIRADLARKSQEQQQVSALTGLDDEFLQASKALEQAEETNKASEAKAEAARQNLQTLRQSEQDARKPMEDADRTAQRLETEVRTLSKLMAGGDAGGYRTILADVGVTQGYETALGAVLGDDLEASLDAEAPRRWSELSGSQGSQDHGAQDHGSQDSALPGGVQSLASQIKAPPALNRRLQQIGLVTHEQGEALFARLAPGQRLVSLQGHVWRWDGLQSEAGAPTAAALRLVEKNRLATVELAAQSAKAESQRLRLLFETAQAAVQAAVQAEAAALTALRQDRQAAEQGRSKVGSLQRRLSDLATQRATVEEAVARLSAQLGEAVERLSGLLQQKQAVEPDPAVDEALKTAIVEADNARQLAAEAQAGLASLEREAAFRSRRRASIAHERQSWAERINRSESQKAEIMQRLDETVIERRQLAEAPDLFQEHRRRLTNEIEAAEGNRRAAADKLAEAETALAVADRQAREALADLAQARENAARLEARLDAAREVLQQARRTIVERLEIEPEGLAPQLAADGAISTQPIAELETRLERLREDRERLGAVNLRAEDELSEIEARQAALDAEKTDLIEAIRRLRGAIGSLNREGRERLLAAFTEVQGHFERLFSLLFGGGTAKLELVESDDPLEAGLEILAHPPGKKPQTMTLLSGGEQALTAISLIFAVFLTNPSPICVLDEVDASLDDANVERYCDLLREMAKTTETRFVVITHNPITMARMDRLYGVTMAERGVSQLVSVDLGEAASFVEAG
ncbi:MAG: chromosome segregation protein SMC [Rhizobiales bacterium]|nr:chromosome segregation protein SMC [Hyphomicrobiales bacterium]